MDDDVRNGDGNTPLHAVLKKFYIWQGDIDPIMGLGAEIDAINDLGETPMHVAVANRFSDAPEVVEYLLGFEPDLNMADFKGNYPLHIAARNCDCMAEVIKLLVENGACISVVNDLGQSPLHLAVGDFACTLDVVKLLSCTCIINQADISRGATPLHYALDQCCRYVNLDVVKYLLDSGAAINVVDKDGDTPLLYFIRECNWDVNVLKLLLDRGASINIVNKDGLSPFKLIVERFGPLWYAAESEKKCVELLITYAVIEIPTFSLKCVFSEWGIFNVLSQFAGECVREIQNLRYEYIADNLTLYDLISRQQVPLHSISTAGDEKKSIQYDMHKILRLLASNKYPIYRERISAKVDRSYSMNELEKLVIYTVPRLSNQPCVNQNPVELDCNSVNIIALYLSNSDLVNLILAFARHYGERL